VPVFGVEDHGDRGGEVGGERRGKSAVSGGVVEVDIGGALRGESAFDGGVGDFDDGIGGEESSGNNPVLSAVF
jgi:hypothetical protein